MIGIIGYGSIGSIFAECLFKENIIYIYTRNSSKNTIYPNVNSVQELCRKCEIILLCIKPNDFENFVENNKNVFNDKHILISVITGVSIYTYEKYFPETKIFRIMTNINININKGVMGICPSKNCMIEDEIRINKLFKNLVYIITKIDDDYFEAFTTIVGSGPAFIAMFFEQMMLASNKLGLIEKNLVLYTLMGTIENLKSKSPEEIIKSVASPKGITQEGINYAEDNNFSNIIQGIYNSSYNKSLSFRK